jgi:hypothetical protein
MRWPDLGAASTKIGRVDAALLRDHGWPIESCRLGAWHAAPWAEAELRGAEAGLAAEFEPPPALVAAALRWADLMSSPAGERWTVERRLADILRRIAAGSVVHRATVASLPALREPAGEIELLRARTAGAS